MLRYMKLSGRTRTLQAVRFLSKSELLIPLSRDLYEASHHHITGNPKPIALFPRALTEEPIDIRRDPKHMKHSRIKKALEDSNFKAEKLLNHRVEKLKQIVGSDFTILSEEAICILCGLSDSRTKLEDSKVVYEGWQFRKLGESVYRTTRDSLLLFSDVQHLSTPSEDLEDLLKQLGDDKVILPLYMKGILIYDLIIPYCGAGRISTEESETKEINETIRDATSIGCFYTLLGILVLKYGKERVVEEYLVPRVFNGNSGIIQHISQRISEHRQ